MPSVGVVGATGAVGRVAIPLLRERGHENVRLFASGRSAGTEIDGTVVEEATPEALAAGGLDVVFFAIGTAGVARARPPRRRPAARSSSTSRRPTGCRTASRSSCPR